MIVLPLCAIIVLIVATSYLILYLIFEFMIIVLEIKTNIDTSKVKVPAPNADEVFSACKQQN